MKNLCIALIMVTSVSSHAKEFIRTNTDDAPQALNMAIDLVKANLQNDDRISVNRNGFYTLTGINPDTQGECIIMLKRGAFAGRETIAMYRLGVVDSDPKTERKNNPYIGLDVKSFFVTASYLKDIVNNGAYSTKIRTSHTRPYWLGRRNTSEIEVNGDIISVTSAFRQSPLNSKSRHYDSLTSITSRTDLLSEVTFNNLNELRPSDKMSCEFQLSVPH